jgi:hypothetical protein
MARIRTTMAQGLPAGSRAQALLDLALDFNAWRRLAESGLSPEQAAEAMTAAIRCQ